LIATASAGEVARVPLVDALALGPERWDALVASSPSPSPFMRWAWLDAWAATAAPDALRESFVLMLRGSTGCDQALLPLGLRPVAFRRAAPLALTWAAGSVGCPDHLDIPARPDLVLDPMLPALEALPWDLVMLSGVAADGANVTRLVEAFARRGFPVRRARVDGCPFLDLPASWDDYLVSLSPTRRQSIRRKERKLIREHAGVVTDYAPERIEEGWAHLCSLHRQRWGGPGALGIPALERLLRRYAGALAANDELWLTTLDLDGEPAAAWLGFAWRDTVYFYQGGRAPRWEPQSVGQVLMGVMIRRAIEHGFRRFDFLRGRDAYKLSWTSTERVVEEVIVFRRGHRGAWLRALDWTARQRARAFRRGEYAGGDA
jgi:CelD/BcsL family acetyltransferase involved in cellulose biosynthesis